MHEHQQQQQQPDRAAPPWPNGEILAELDRPGYDGRPDRRLVVTLESYLGNSYVGIRIGQRGAQGSLVPAKVGTFVRLRECHAVADALRKAVESVEARRDAPPAQEAAAT